MGTFETFVKHTNAIIKSIQLCLNVIWPSLDKLMRSFIASCDRRCLSKLKIWHLRLPIHDFKLHCIHYISLDDLLLVFIQSKHSSYDGLYCATFYVFQQEVFASLFSRYRTCFRNRNRVSGLWLIRRYKFRFFSGITFLSSSFNFCCYHMEGTP